MKSFSMLLLALAALGCDPAPVATTEGNANPLASSGAAPVAQPVKPQVDPVAEEMDETVAPPPVKATNAQKQPYAKLVNAGGKIDAGLPKTASPGAKLPVAGDDIVTLQTEQGDIVVKFFPGKAPGHVGNFLALVKRGFYDGTRFHRTIPGFMIQGGDPNTKDESKRATWGQGGPKYSVRAEFNDMLHTPGILSMARSQDPNSAGSQFFVMHGVYPSLDNQYTVFGQVLKGMDVVEKIVLAPAEGDLAVKPVMIVKATAAKWPVKL